MSLKSIQCLSLMILGVLVSGVAGSAADWKDEVMRGSDLHVHGRYGEAQEAFRQALLLVESDPLETHGRAVVLSHLGTLAQDQGDLALAERYYLRCLSTLENASQAANSEIATVIMSLTVVYLDGGQIGKAERFARRGLVLLERKDLPKDMPAKLTYIFGAVRHSQGDLTAADRSYRHALQMKNQIGLTPDETDAHILNNLGVLALDRGDISTAKEVFERSLSIEETLNGAADRSVVKPLVNLATADFQNGNLLAAKHHLQRALEVAEARLSPKDPLLGKVLVNYSVLARNMNDKRTARDYARRGRQILAGSYSQAVTRSTIDITMLGQPNRRGQRR